MARLCPSLAPRAALTAGAHAELELLETLERGLSNAFTLFHSVDWARVSDDRAQHGEVDIVVLNQAGEVLLIEIKAGEVNFRPAGMFKAYGGSDKDVGTQCRQQYSAVRSRLDQAGLAVHVSHLLVLPNVRVATDTVQWPRARIVDCDDIGQIVSRVLQLLGAGAPQPALLARVEAFFANRFQVELDVSALSGRLQRVSTRLSAGLATWVPRIAAPSGVIRVVGTAGSGKTQLALRLLCDADAAQLKAAYLCFNRALADHMATVAPVRVRVETFHEMALRIARAAGTPIDFSQAETFRALEVQAVQSMEQAVPDLDLLVIDEVQDMQPAWVQALLVRVKDAGRVVLMEDPEQALYSDREPFEVADAVTVVSQENYRSPRALVGLINLLGLTAQEIVALSPHQGVLADPLVYDAPERIAARTVTAVERCRALGFALADIAIVSLKGRERSVLQQQDRLGPWTLSRYTGRFDEGGSAIWTSGEMLIDSVRRFKGQSAAAVVLTECDLPALDQMGRRLLFVGLTRARMHLEWVVSPRMATAIEVALGS